MTDVDNWIELEPGREFGTCSVCGHMYALRGDGTVWEHQGARFDGSLCDGQRSSPIRRYRSVYVPVEEWRP